MGMSFALGILYVDGPRVKSCPFGNHTYRWMGHGPLLAALVTDALVRALRSTIRRTDTMRCIRKLWTRSQCCALWNGNWTCSKRGNVEHKAAHHLFEHEEAEPLNEGTLDLANVDRRVE